jgi:hypothetical protein
MLRIIGCVGNRQQYGYSVCTSGCLYPLILHSQAMESKQTTPNTEMTLIVDVDINLLKNCTNTEASNEGSQT